MGNNKDNLSFLNYFLEKFNYSIYTTHNKKIASKNIMDLLKKLNKRYQTIGNYYLIKNNSKAENIFLHE